MDQEEHAAKLLEWLGKASPGKLSSIGDALYAMSENGLWPDFVDSVSEEQAVLCWRLVERLRVTKFPAALRM